MFGAMFDKKLTGEARVLVDEGNLHPGIGERVGGVFIEHHRYVLEVQQQGGQPFRVETRCKVCAFTAPKPGDMVNVRYGRRSHKTEMMLRGDPRYDEFLRDKLALQKQKQLGRQKAADAKAVLQGANPEDLPGAKRR
jgi:hypothetical protein